jgi:manganese/zinc/iron transport system permease protein
MNTISITIAAIAFITSLACSLPGLFLVLRGVALLSDAMSHAILLGIVSMFLITKQLNSPLLFVGAVLAGIVTVVCTEYLLTFKYIKKDAAIGLVFPLFFSIAVILISTCARTVHLDTDMVLLGELAFAPFNRIVINGIDYGPQSLWIMGTILLINSSVLWYTYHQLTLTLFDAHFAHSIGRSPTLFFYGLMIITSITAVGAFDVVGSLVVVALMIVPAATALLVAQRLEQVMVVTVVTAAAGALGGYALAIALDASLAGSIAVFLGLQFVIALILQCIPTRLNQG